ncbi:MAG TPA: antibiotic biosynthesis monooxygenase [Candidatus Acidoferrales bacterium]|nr:antibiotic biosynthesis monooxygenase [Candidatus Acidoferrales bacterium]
MIARTWHGAVTAEKSGEYLGLLRTVGLAEYLSVPGNRGAYVLERTDGDTVHFILISFWDSVEAIKAYAGEDISLPRYTKFDPDFLSDLAPSVQHHSVYSD